MTPAETFVRKAVEGGWIPKGNDAVVLTLFDKGVWANGVLLDPDLWRCAGRALGWTTDGTSHEGTFRVFGPWLLHWHGLLDALAYGQTADAYLATLTDER